MKTFAPALLGCFALVYTAAAAPIAPIPTSSPTIRVDWQDPQTLPRRFRNHCAYDRLSGRYYCSDHCGFQYQFSYCSPASFGCCRIGFGYCDWRGILRCAP
jgi:hypothetical protein